MSDIPPKAVDLLVLGTVNASFRTELSVDQLAGAIRRIDIDINLPHLATFFSEVRDTLVLAFAEHHGISLKELEVAYPAVKVASGEFNENLERDFARLTGDSI